MRKLDLDPAHTRTPSNTFMYDIQTLQNRSLDRSQEFQKSLLNVSQPQLKKSSSKITFVKNRQKDSLVDFIELEKNLYMQRNIDEIEN